MKTESMLSAGIDIGTTTTHLVISRIGIGVTEGFGTVPSVHITSKKVLYKSDVVFTPLLSDGKIDAHTVTAIIKEQYKKAGVTPDELKCGAVIVTGESACRENASEVISLQPRQAANSNLTFPAKAPGQTLSAKTRGNVPLMLT